MWYTERLPGLTARAGDPPHDGHLPRASKARPGERNAVKAKSPPMTLPAVESRKADIGRGKPSAVLMPALSCRRGTGCALSNEPKQAQRRRAPQPARARDCPMESDRRLNRGRPSHESGRAKHVTICAPHDAAAASLEATVPQMSTGKGVQTSEREFARGSRG
jgi:hypothetical protein